jgi:hypothetical protein
MLPVAEVTKTDPTKFSEITIAGTDLSVNFAGETQKNGFVEENYKIDGRSEKLRVLRISAGERVEEGSDGTVTYGFLSGGGTIEVRQGENEIHGYFVNDRNNVPDQPQFSLSPKSEAEVIFKANGDSGLVVAIVESDVLSTT